MIVGVPREIFPGESRVALVPEVVSALKNSGIQTLLESGAGHSDGAYSAKGAKIAPSRSDLFDAADAILQVRALGANPDATTSI